MAKAAKRKKTGTGGSKKAGSGKTASGSRTSDADKTGADATDDAKRRRRKATVTSIERRRADRVVRQHVLWAMGAGLIPVPLVDFAAVTGIQVDMLAKLAKVYGIEHAASTGKSFVVAVTGTTVARIGASLVKLLPGVGSVLGGVSMSVMSGASTFAVAQVALERFARGQDILSADLYEARASYESAYEKGKEYVSDLDDKKEQAQEVFRMLERLGELRDQGVLSEEEFEEQKAKLLNRL